MMDGPPNITKDDAGRYWLTIGPDRYQLPADHPTTAAATVVELHRWRAEYLAAIEAAQAAEAEALAVYDQHIADLAQVYSLRTLAGWLGVSHQRLHQRVEGVMKGRRAGIG